MVENVDCYTVGLLLKARHKLCCNNGIENCVILITKFYSNECVERVLADQPSAIHCRGPEGETLLMYAKDINVLNTLFKYKPDVNVSDDNRENVLFHFIHQRNHKFKIFAWDCMFFEMIRCVLRHGLDVNATDGQDKSAIEYLLTKDSDQYFQLINILLAAGAIIPPRDSTGRTPVMQLASKAYHEEYFNIIERLLNQGADPKARDDAASFGMEQGT
ncbi:hypothetical protein B566_EDAN011550 [Ephemera danica]|nr:hypothetical protein B566_EDAN011550 [Ephemera danica]